MEVASGVLHLFPLRLAEWRRKVNLGGGGGAPPAPQGARPKGPAGRVRIQQGHASGRPRFQRPRAKGEPDLASKTLLVTAVGGLVLAALAAPAAAQAPSDPLAPNPDCDPAETYHRWTAGGDAVGGTLNADHGAGSAHVVDGAISCPPEPLCPAAVDVDGDGEADATVPCPPLVRPLGPGSDGEYEWGFGGQFLPDSHHAARDGFVSVTCTLDATTGCPFRAGRDGDGDGLVLDGQDAAAATTLGFGRDGVDCLTALLRTPFSGFVTDATDGRSCGDGGAFPDDAGTWVFVDALAGTGGGEQTRPLAVLDGHCVRLDLDPLSPSGPIRPPAGRPSVAGQAW